MDDEILRYCNLTSNYTVKVWLFQIMFGSMIIPDKVWFNAYPCLGLVQWLSLIMFGLMIIPD